MTSRPAERARKAALAVLTAARADLERRVLEASADADDSRLHRELLDRLIHSYQRVVVERDRTVRELAEDLALARVIQRQLLPAAPPRFPGLELATHYEPSGSVGGDFYDFIAYPDGNELGILVGDVSGHGVAGALLMALFHSALLRHLAVAGDLHQQFSGLNRELAGILPDGRYASTFFMRYDRRDRSLTYLKAAQEAGYWLRADGSVTVLDAGGPLLGAIDPELFGPPAYAVGRIELRPGDRLLCATDGLVEAAGADGEPFGQERLTAALSRLVAAAPGDMIESLRREVLAYIAPQPLADDFTVIAAAVTTE